MELETHPYASFPKIGESVLVRLVYFFIRCGAERVY